MHASNAIIFSVYYGGLSLSELFFPNLSLSNGLTTFVSVVFATYALYFLTNRLQRYILLVDIPKSIVEKVLLNFLEMVFDGIRFILPKVIE